MVAGRGFEPLKAEPADLQSAPIGRSGNPPLAIKWTELYRSLEKSLKFPEISQVFRLSAASAPLTMEP